MEDTTGIVKLIAERGSGRLLGAHIMGYQASSIIQPLIQAMSFGLTAAEMARGQYWIHPALPEVVENALLVCTDVSVALLALRAQAAQRQAGPLRQRERTARHRVLERRAQLPRGHLDNRAALGAHRVVVRGGGQPVGRDTAVEGQRVQHALVDQGGHRAVDGRQVGRLGAGAAGTRAAAGGSPPPAGAR